MVNSKIAFIFPHPVPDAPIIYLNTCIWGRTGHWLPDIYLGCHRWSGLEPRHGTLGQLACFQKCRSLNGWCRWLSTAPSGPPKWRITSFPMSQSAVRNVPAFFWETRRARPEILFYGQSKRTPRRYWLITRARGLMRCFNSTKETTLSIAWSASLPAVTGCWADKTCQKHYSSLQWQ